MRRSQAPKHERFTIEADSVTIGKDVVELFTTGMYVAPVTIYREYIQNAADSIDEGRESGLLPKRGGEVTVSIDHINRCVVIRDNGAGIASDQAVRRLLAIGGSRKRGTLARGFRGIGRLAGLAFCRQLLFKTKAADERTITTVIWDCQALRQLLSDEASIYDLKEALSRVVSVEYSEAKESKSGSFFEVHLNDVVRLRHDVLLNESLIANYLGETAPVPFAPEFSHGQVIEDKILKRYGVSPISIRVGGEKVHRRFRDQVSLPASQHKIVIRGVDFVEFANVDGDVGAIGWIAQHQFARSIPVAPGIRGLRARVRDLQVGEEDIFADSFKEPRFNGWNIGEIHIIDPRIVPNARRDNFVVNHHYYNLLAQIGPLAARITQKCRQSSISRNSEQGLLNLIGEVKSRLNEKRALEQLEVTRLKASVLRARSRLKVILDSELRASLAEQLDQLEALISERNSAGGESVVAVDQVLVLIGRIVTNRTQARKVQEELRRLCR